MERRNTKILVIATIVLIFALTLAFALLQIR